MPVYDQAALVRDGVASVRDAMIVGAALAVLILLLFLREWRITAISATAIPLTLIITVVLMRVIGQTFNLMTLGAMAIAIGLVIDDAVVVTENIVRHLRIDGTARLRAALQELIGPITSSTLTTVVVFLPLGLLQGVSGQFFAAFSITLTTSVLVSLVLALTIIPLLSEQWLHRELTLRSTSADASRGVGAHWSRARRLTNVTIGSRRVASARGDHRRCHFLDGWRRVCVSRAAHGLSAHHGRRCIHRRLLNARRNRTRGNRPSIAHRRALLAEMPEVMGTSRRTGAELGLFATEQNAVTSPCDSRPRSRDRGIEENRRSAR